jgi:nucleoside-diphosphate-sugar epimerase
VKGVDHIYHCAAQISTIAGRKQAIFANNVLGTRNLLAAALQHRVRRVVVTSSLSAVEHRIGGPADETEPFNPFDEHLPYAVSKAAAEHECLKAVADGLDVVIAISCAIVGPNDFKPSRMGTGFHRLFVEGHVLAMRRGRSGQRYIFSSEFMTLDAIFDVYRDLTGRPKPLRLPTALNDGSRSIGGLGASLCSARAAPAADTRGRAPAARRPPGRLQQGATIARLSPDLGRGWPSRGV